MTEKNETPSTEEWLKENVLWYDVIVKNISQYVPCPRGTKLGQEWALGWNSRMTPEGMCPGAYNSLLPYALALQHGASFPWLSDPDVIRVSCPDREKIAVYELRRLRESGKQVPGVIERRRIEVRNRQKEKEEMKKMKEE